MAKPSAHPKFKALKKKWDRILAETGFEDLEDERGNLKQRASRYEAYGGGDPISRKAKTDFFAQAAQHLSRTRFPNKRDRFIMECYVDGVKQVEIRRTLHARGMGLSRVYMWKIIRKWLVKWNLK